jgi:hypothetical protein
MQQNIITWLCGKKATGKTTWIETNLLAHCSEFNSIWIVTHLDNSNYKKLNIDMLRYIIVDPDNNKDEMLQEIETLQTADPNHRVWIIIDGVSKPDNILPQKYWMGCRFRNITITITTQFEKNVPTWLRSNIDTIINTPIIESSIFLLYVMRVMRKRRGMQLK